VTFHLAQVLTGHGCFGDYLCRIKKEPTTQCHHCTADQDSAQHTLEFCPPWAEERRVLVSEVGADLSLGTVMAAMVSRETAWRAVVSFCSKVMLQKEEQERLRRGEGPARLPLATRVAAEQRAGRGRLTCKRPRLESPGNSAGRPARRPPNAQR